MVMMLGVFVAAVSPLLRRWRMLLSPSWIKQCCSMCAVVGWLHFRYLNNNVNACLIERCVVVVFAAVTKTIFLLLTHFQLLC